MPSQAYIDLSSSMSVNMDKRETIDAHFKWESIQKFIYLAYAYSSDLCNFDVFSKVIYKIRLFDFIFTQAALGMTYLFMDFFIKMYTRRLDSAKLLNPLLRGVAFGMLLQSGLWTLVHAYTLADCYRFLLACFQSAPPWSQCPSDYQNNTCKSAGDIVYECNIDSKNTSFDFLTTSAHFNYVQTFDTLDRTAMTTKFFGIAIAWVFNFFFSSVSDDSIIKIFKLAFLCRTLSTIVTLCFILISSHNQAATAFVDIFNVTTEHSHIMTMEHLTYIYGIGFIGLVDFGSMSPYTMPDNAVVIYTLTFTAFAFTRSWIVRILYLELTRCVSLRKIRNSHYLVFAILPLSTEFLAAQKLYVAYIYFNVMVATTAYIALTTIAMARLLHTEFRSVKNIYIIGVICCAGFGLSIIMAMSLASNYKVYGLLNGFHIMVLYLGAFKAAVIMYLYGVQRLATDIQFWLNFKPTKFWIICWTMLPIIYVIFMVVKINILMGETNMDHFIFAWMWIAFTLLVTTFFQIKTLARFIMRNNIAGLLSANMRYGPPDPEDRKRRRVFNETTQLRQCKHNCNPLDEMIDCSHMPLIQRTGSDQSMSATSLTNIFEARRDKMRASTSLGLELHH